MIEFPKMQVKRLKKLIAILRRVEAREKALARRGVESMKFDMSTWGWGRHGKIGLSESLCGTSACALGWAATDKGFRKAGLRLEFSDTYADGYGGAGIVFKRKKADAPVYDADAGAAFFGLTGEESGHIFLSSEDGVPAAVERIRSVMNGEFRR